MPAAAAPRPRVLVVDDDAALRKLVAMVLEVLDIEALICASGAEALTVLRAAPVQLLITDLMMPGVSGYDLLQALADTPALRGPARVVVFSAGLDPAARARLAPLGVWRLLGKPVSVRALEDCVRDALVLAHQDAAGLAGAARAASADGLATSAPDAADEADEADAEQAAIHRYFAGQTALFETYRADCLAQFAEDLQAGDRALAAHDAPTLRRLAHNLKSVLSMLGMEAAALQVQALEAAAVADDGPAMAAGWGRVSWLLRRRWRAATPSARG